MSLGPYAGYIVASYVIVGIVLAALGVSLVRDGIRHRRTLADLEARGVRRRSAGAPGTTASRVGRP